LLGTLQPINDDTQIYHLQIIQWLNHYKALPGIANLYPRFGLGSNWFNLISFFYWPIFTRENFTYLNTAFVIWFFLWLFSKSYYYFEKKDADNNRILSFFYFLSLIYFIVDWQLFRDAANSTNYDFAVTAFTIIVFSFFFEGILSNVTRTNFSFPIFLFSLCAVSFKLSGIFLLSFVFYHFIMSWKTVKWFIVITAGMFILLPVLIKNYIITGYPLFPSTITINTPDWIFPKQLAIGFYRYIILSNRFYNHQWAFINKIHPDSFNWIPYWFKGILIQHRIILGLAISSILFLFIKLSLAINTRQLRNVIVVLLLMLTGWFFTAPDPGRFGYGILLSLSFLTVSLLFYQFFKEKIYLSVLLCTTIVMLIYGIKKSLPIINNLAYIIYPESFADPHYEIVRINDVEVKFPQRIDSNLDCRCYQLSPPCIIQKNPYLETRGKSISDGFRMDQPDSGFIKSYLY